MRMGDGGKREAFQLTQQQEWLIQEDSPNQKLWDEVLASLKEGPVCFWINSCSICFNCSYNEWKQLICNKLIKTGSWIMFQSYKLQFGRSLELV